MIRELIATKTKDNGIDNGSNNRPFQICETGFGAGHSAALFLSSFDNDDVKMDVRVVTFDKFDRPYQLPIVKKLQQKFEGRLTYIQGNSCKTVPAYLEKKQEHRNGSGRTRDETDGNNVNDDTFDFAGCDFLHGSSLCPTDNIDLVRHAKCGTILTSTAMHSLSDTAVYFGPNAQWRKLREDRCIADITCFRENPLELDPDHSYIFAKNMKIIAHEFCFARVTGVCHYSRDGGRAGGGRRRHGDATDLLDDDECADHSTSDLLSNLCPEDTIEPPL
mmetsp:Transcript_27038/g.41413  ORF Transcript_27038/g.41413 Transcript_27038/m.41413 type:complete len:276 (-) Transcript_27038:249-1076(-)